MADERAAGAGGGVTGGIGPAGACAGPGGGVAWGAGRGAAAPGGGARAADLERLEALRPIDDEFMRCVLRGQRGLVQLAVGLLTGEAGLEVVEFETQRDLKALGARSVLLDVWARDASGRRVDVEFERSGPGADPRRARYHAALMDADALPAGAGFDALPRSHVVFVVERDPFGRGRALYRFERREASGELLGDGSAVSYAVAGRGEGELGALLRDMLRSDPDEMETEVLADRVRHLKRDPEGVAEMTGVFDEIRREGEEIGEQKGRRQALAALVRDGLLAARDAAARAGVTEDEMRALAAAS